MHTFNENPEQVIDEQTALIMYMRFTEQYPYDVIAEEVGIPEEQAQQIALKGLRYCKDLMFGQ